jgi:hypothetical protein
MGPVPGLDPAMHTEICLGKRPGDWPGGGGQFSGSPRFLSLFGIVIGRFALSVRLRLVLVLPPTVTPGHPEPAARPIERADEVCAQRMPDRGQHIAALCGLVIAPMRPATASEIKDQRSPLAPSQLVTALAGRLIIEPLEQRLGAVGEALPDMRQVILIIARGHARASPPR